MTLYAQQLAASIRPETLAPFRPPPEPVSVPRYTLKTHAAVEAWEAVKNPQRGDLTAIAAEHRVSPGAILTTIKRRERLKNRLAAEGKSFTLPEKAMAPETEPR